MTANNFSDIETGFVNSQTTADLPKPHARMRIQELKLYRLRKTLVKHNPALKKEVYFLPVRIKTLKLHSVGPLKKSKAHFRRNSVNVIYGSNASGKSTIIRSILLPFGNKHSSFSNKLLKNGTITLELFPNQISITIRGMEYWEKMEGYQCMLADDPFARFDQDTFGLLVNELNRLDIQSIVTANTSLDTDAFPKGTCIISLNKT